MCGLPGSGKSSFSQALAKSSDKWVIISQDDLGSKEECDVLLDKSIKNKKNIIIDRCNVTKNDRKYWLESAKSTTAIVHMNIDSNLCAFRIKNRSNHPTVKAGTGESIIKSFVKQYEPPTEHEIDGNFYSIETPEEIESLLKKWGADNIDLSGNLIKFPRTPHLLDIREFDKTDIVTVCRDDLLMSKAQRNEFLNVNVTIEEKIDGANMGISIGPDMKLMCQNRSHYVNSSTQEQFKYLDTWIEQHNLDLYEILENGRYILYGEWCYARHGIHYKYLSDYFIAFDIYDKYYAKFLSREHFYLQLSKGPSIFFVPIIASGTFSKVEDIYKLIQKDSEFTTGPIEGLYIKKDNGRFLEGRCKIVAATFHESFDKHWIHKKFEKNIIKF